MVTANGTAKLSNYMLVKRTANLQVTPAPLTVTTDAKSRVYGDDNPPFTGSITGIQNGDAITASFGCSATITSPVGGYPITASLSDPGNKLGNYTVTNAGNTLTISPANQTITWADPAGITYGTALSGTQLNATVAGVSGGSAPGVLTYSPVSGTVLNAGLGQALTVSAVATTNYNAASKTVHIDVAKATSNITWANPADITYGTASATQLDATSPVAGTFSYRPAAGTVLGVGAHQALTATFTPTDTADYNPTSATVFIDVAQAGTSTAVTSSVSTPVFGQSVTFTATVAIASPGVGTPTGTVTFKDGSNTLGTGTLSDGTATLTVPSTSPVIAALAVGTHSITASYGGDTNDLTSTSSALTETVNQNQTTTSVSVSTNYLTDNQAVPLGQEVTLAATVTANESTVAPTGLVDFFDGPTKLGTRHA